MTEEERQRLEAELRLVEIEIETEMAKANNPAEKRISDNDKATDIAGSTGYRALQSFADLPLGAAQLGLNAADYFIDDFTLDDSMNNFMNRREQLIEDGRSNLVNQRPTIETAVAMQNGVEAPPRDPGFDWTRMAGNMAGSGPLGFLSGAGKTVRRKVLEGVAGGGGTSALMPVAGDPGNYWDTKTNQAKEGMLFGGILPAGVATAAKTGGLTKTVTNSILENLSPILDSASTSVQKVFNQAIPSINKSEALRRLETNRGGSAGEILSGLNLPVFAQIQKYADDIDPTATAIRNKAQQDSREAVLDSVAGTPDQIAAAKAVRAGEYSRTGEPALTAAGDNTQKIITLQQTIDRLEGRNPGSRTVTPVQAQSIDPRTGSDLPITGTVSQQSMPPARPPGNAVESIPDAVQVKSALQADEAYYNAKIDNYRTIWGAKPGKVANPEAAKLDPRIEEIDEFKTAAIANEAAKKAAKKEAFEIRSSMEANGIKPLTTSSVVDRLESVRADPNTGSAAQLILKKVIKAIKDESVDGVIDPVRLYRMRKLDLGEFVERTFAQQGSKKHQAALVSSAKVAIDDAIESASGGGWKSYLANFSKMSREIEAMEAGAVLKKTLFGGGRTYQDPAEGSRAYANQLSKLREEGGIEMFGGESPGGKWGDLARLEADLTQSADQRFREKSGTAGDLLDEAPQVPGMLNRTVMILNSSMRGIFGINHARNLALLGKVMQRDPEKGFSELAKYINNIPEQGPKMEFIKQVGPDIAQKLIDFGMVIKPGAIGAYVREENTPSGAEIERAIMEYKNAQQ